MRLREVVGAIVIEQGRMLFTLSDNNVWTPPGGKKESGESDQQCAERELLEELDTRIKFGDFFSRFEIRTPTKNQRMRVSCYFAKLLDDPKPQNEILKIIWSDCPENLNLSEGTRDLVAQLRQGNRL